VYHKKQSVDNKRPKRLKQKCDEVVFAQNAQVFKYFAAAIKCWRITAPSIIQIEN
jgi:hypothetical protein